jgi:hypothetical protein
MLSKCFSNNSSFLSFTLKALMIELLAEKFHKKGIMPDNHPST